MLRRAITVFTHPISSFLLQATEADLLEQAGATSQGAPPSASSLALPSLERENSLGRTPLSDSDAAFLTPRENLDEEEEPEVPFSTPGRHAAALARAEAEAEAEPGVRDNETGQQAPRKLLDPVMLENIEGEAQCLAASIAALLAETQDSLGTASAISAQCAQAYDESTGEMGQRVDEACAAMEAMLGECGKLEGTFDSMDQCAARLKQLRGEVDALDAMMKRSTKLKSLKAS